MAGKWRLPNVRELQSLVDYGVFNPAVPNASGIGQWSEGDPFLGVQSFYWSSTTAASGPGSAWGVGMLDGFVFFDDKGGGKIPRRVWPVRGGLS